MYSQSADLPQSYTEDCPSELSVELAHMRSKVSVIENGAENLRPCFKSCAKFPDNKQIKFNLMKRLPQP